MIRVLLFLLVVLFLGLGFAWFADRPGDVVLDWQGNEYKTSLMVVLVGLVAIVSAIMIIWWLARTILDSPKIMRRFFSARKKDRGYRALSQGLIAANSGDAASARRFTKESVRLLGREPLVDLLDAQSALLEGKREDARKRFEGMLENDETRLVALRGLYLEAERQGAKDAARHYAEEAHKAAPSLPWAGNAKLRYASMDGDWEGALKALEANKSAGLIDKDTAKRQRAVLLTAQAMACEPADPVLAAKLAREAHKLAPTLVPAAVIGAKALARNSDIGRAAGMIETVWKKEPHPDLAASYVHLRMGDSAADRLKRAKKLAAMKANHPEGNFAIAEAALDAHDWRLAREALKSVLLTKPSERACLLMSEIEEGEFGDKGRMRDWLSRAVRSPKDAAWTADGYISDKWLPISPLTGRVDAFEWKVPLEQLDAPTAEVLDAEGLEDLIREPEKAPIVEKPVSNAPTKTGNETAPVSATAGAALATRAADTKPDDTIGKSGAKADTDDAALTVDAEVIADEDQRPADKDEASSADLEPKEQIGEITSTVTPIGKPDEEANNAADATVDHAAEKVDEKPVEADVVTGGGKEEKAAAPSKAINGNDAKKDASKKSENGKQDVKHSKAEFILDRRPDDPGIRDEDLKPKPKRFGIF